MTSDRINLLCLTRLTPEERARIEAVDPRIELVYAAGWFDGELAETWPPATSGRYVKTAPTGRGTRAERDAMLAAANIVLINFPFPKDLRARAPNVKWVHQRPAGASNLAEGDLWGSDVLVTTSRGYAANLPIAEFVVAGFLHFARGLHRAAVDRAARDFDRVAYAPVQLAGKTALIVGAGGIGREAGRLAAGLGMHVIGTRRTPDGELPEGFAEMHAGDALPDLLPRADFVAVCCQWTPETEGLIGPAAFAAMKPGAVLVNVARGEIVDTDALLDALAQDRLRGAVLDVYTGEFDGPPPDALWDDPRVLITPHVSGGTEASIRTRAVEIFCRNLRAWLDGRPLENVIDWQRGY